MADQPGVQTLTEKMIWKGKQKYSQFRCWLGGGQFIWRVDDQVRFVSYRGDPFSHVLYVCRGHEKTELNWCDRWLNLGPPDQSIVDCGANIGYFSAVLAQRCSLSTIIAVEGNQAIARLCRNTFKTLNLRNSRVIEAILSENTVDHYSIPDRPGREPWQQAIKVDATASTIQTTTLDQLVMDTGIHPGLIKIDCEGFEPLILKGAIHTLKTIRPAFMIECNDLALHLAGTNRRELFGILRQYDYQLFHLASFTGFHPLGLAIDESFSSAEFNFAAIPNDEANLARWTHSI